MPTGKAAQFLIVTLLISPTSSSAQVDPYTAVQTISGVIGVIGGIAGSINNSEWQSKAAGKLDKIVDQNERILAEFRDLRVFVPAALEQSFRNELAFKINSLSHNFDGAMRAPKPSKKIFRDMRLEVSQTAFNLSQRGPSVYQAAGASVTLTLAVYKMAGNVTVQEKRYFLETMIKQMREWAGFNEDMLGFAYNNAIQDEKNSRAELAAFPRGSVVLAQQGGSIVVPGFKPDGSERRMPCTMYYSGIITIDDKALSVNISDNGTRGCGRDASFSESAASESRSKKYQEVQNLFRDIRKNKARAEELLRHRTSLLKMIEIFETQLPNK